MKLLPVIERVIFFIGTFVVFYILAKVILVLFIWLFSRLVY